MMPLKKSIAGFLFCLVFASCGGRQNGIDHDNLGEVSRMFNHMVRWQRWDIAARYVTAKDQQAWLQKKSSNSQGLKIAEVIFAGVTRDPPDSKEAKVYVQLNWHRMPSTTIQQTLWTQSWTLEKKVGWRLVGEETGLPEAPKKTPAPSWP